MKKIVGVSFKNNGDIHDFLYSDEDLEINDKGIVSTESGPLLGNVEKISELKKDNRNIKKLNNVIRKCTKKDIANNENNIIQSKKALAKCKELVKELDLNMIILDAKYNFDKSQLLFRFLSDSRVDFRELAKKLASIYKTRIELKQIGVRDKAREIGGYGYCGRKLCCSRFSYDFDTVSINMAKNQNIALNPTKINGLCGRLMCCLKYEDECYKECNKKLPKLGSKIKTEFGEGKVISVEPLKQIYKVDIKDKGIVEINLNESNK